jgi:hypothetical protein
MLLPTKTEIPKLILDLLGFIRDEDQLYLLKNKIEKEILQLEIERAERRIDDKFSNYD